MTINLNNKSHKTIKIMKTYKMYNISSLILGLLFLFFPIMEVNSQLLKELRDKSNKLSSKIMDKAFSKMPGGNMLKDASKATREYEDLNYHYKFSKRFSCIFYDIQSQTW